MKYKYFFLCVFIFSFACVLFYPLKHSSIIMFNNICNGSLTNTENTRSLSPSSSPRTNGEWKYQASPSPPPPQSQPTNNIPIPSNKFTSNNKTTSYYHTFNCSRDMKKRKSVNNFLNRDMTNNTINELKNNFERLIEETQRQAGKKQQQQQTTTIINNLHNSTNINMNGNGINNSRIFSNRQDILMNTDRRNKKLTTYGDDLSNIDVKSLVSIFFCVFISVLQCHVKVCRCVIWVSFSFYVNIWFAFSLIYYMPFLFLFSHIMLIILNNVILNLHHHHHTVSVFVKYVKNLSYRGLFYGNAWKL